MQVTHSLTGKLPKTLQEEIDFCDAQIAEVETLLRQGHLEIHGLILALQDWSREKRLVEMELQLKQALASH